MGLVSGLFGSGKKAARIQAAAIKESSDRQARNDRLVAQAAQQSLETQLAQKQAADKAAELLNKPQDQIDVQLAPDAPLAELDETTGRRKTRRNKFQRAGSSTGISI